MIELLPTETISRLSIRRRLTRGSSVSRQFSGKGTFHVRPGADVLPGTQTGSRFSGRCLAEGESPPRQTRASGMETARKRYEKIFFTRSSRYIYSNLFKFEFTAAVSAAAAHVPATQSRFKYDFGRAKIPATSASPAINTC